MVVMSSIASIESELRNQLSSIPRLPLRGHPLSWGPSQKGTFALRHTIFTHFLLSILFSLSFRCLRGFSLTFFDAVSHARAHVRLPWDFHFFAFTTFTRVLFQTRKIGLL